ncbi:MAG: diguanylate cyclase [Proteobacteria bacterium]|nr:diguanylate cyclase [Pseudomonadota bacterium]
MLHGNPTLVSPRMPSSPDSGTTGSTTFPNLQGLIDASTGASILIDRDGVILAINETGARRFKLSREAAIGRNLLGLFPEDLARTRQQILLQVRHDGQPNIFEDEREGRYYRNSALPVFNQHGQVEQIGIFSEDITERRLIEQKLQESEAQYRFLAESTSDVVWHLDARMCFSYISSADFRERGFLREEVIGTPVAEVYTPEGKAILNAVISERMAKQARGEKVEQTIRFEAPELRKDGSVFWAETVSTRILDANGQICGFVGITRNIEERRSYQLKLEEANQQLKTQLAEISALQRLLEEKAVRDALTGLYNRHYLHETLSRELARARREKTSLAIVMMDLDLFKTINDTYGHATGDQVIRMTATILQQGSRESDIACRYGGEEFLVVLPDISLEHALMRAETWRTAIADAHLPHEGGTIQTTASLGISIFPGQADDIDELLAAADAALYASKHRGRNCVSVFTPG